MKSDHAACTCNSRPYHSYHCEKSRAMRVILVEAGKPPPYDDELAGRYITPVDFHEIQNRHYRERQGVFRVAPKEYQRGWPEDETPVIYTGDNWHEYETALEQGRPTIIDPAYREEVLNKAIAQLDQAIADAGGLPNGPEEPADVADLLFDPRPGADVWGRECCPSCGTPEGPNGDRSMRGGSSTHACDEAWHDRPTPRTLAQRALLIAIISLVLGLVNVAIGVSWLLSTR